jgi:hypothetical protein
VAITPRRLTHLTRRGFPGCLEDNATPNVDGTVGEAFIETVLRADIRGGYHVERPILLLKKGEQGTATVRRLCLVIQVRCPNGEPQANRKHLTKTQPVTSLRNHNKTHAE